MPEIRTDSLAIDERDFFSRENDPQRPSRMDGSIEAGCLTEGHHRLLRFTILCYNKGDKAFEIGKPEDRPDIFARPAELGFPKARHQWYMREKFYLYTLRNDSGSVNLSGYKRPWCLADFKRFDCSRMGIDPGLADTYQSDLECQFIVIEGLEDGEYTIEALANAPSVLAFKRGNTEKILFEEDNYNDNCVAIRIKIRGNDLPEYLGPGICKMM